MSACSSSSSSSERQARQPLANGVLARLQGENGNDVNSSYRSDAGASAVRYMRSREANYLVEGSHEAAGANKKKSNNRVVMRL